MTMKSYQTVQFELDDSEKEILEKAREIMRKAKETFFLEKMLEHQQKMEDAMELVWQIYTGKEIVE